MGADIFRGDLLYENIPLMQTDATKVAGLKS